MSEYTLNILLRSDLCAASGKSSGSFIDTDIRMDEYGLPYIPGRTLKGVLRESAVLLKAALSGTQKKALPFTVEQLDRLFFPEGGENAAQLTLSSAQPQHADQLRRELEGILSDKSALSQLRVQARPDNVAELFTSVRGQTAMEDGVAKQGTLRYTRVLNQFYPDGTPMVLEAKVTLPEDCLPALEAVCAATRHMGLHRTRGLGQVKLTLAPVKKKADPISPVHEGFGEYQDDTDYTLTYTLRLDSPITLPEGEESAAIPARSVIGCLAGNYLKTGSAEDAAFAPLFLDGTARWSALTPVVKGKPAMAAPGLFFYPKHDKNDLRNSMAEKIKREQQAEEIKIKRKAVTGAFAVNKEGHWLLTTVDTQINSHNNLHYDTDREGGLYFQNALLPGYLYGGTVTLPGKWAEAAEKLLKEGRLAFGHSKGAQYGQCTLLTLTAAPVREETLTLAPGEKLVVLLESDLVLLQGGNCVCAPVSIRASLGESLGFTPTNDPAEDGCAYHSIRGYSQSYGLQKPRFTAVAAGSRYILQNGAEEKQPRRRFQVGSFAQEGMGSCLCFTEKEAAAFTAKWAEPETVKATEAQRLRPLLLVAAGRAALEEQAHTKARIVLEGQKDRKSSYRHLPDSRLRNQIQEADTPDDCHKLADEILDKKKMDAAKSLMKLLLGQGQLTAKKLLTQPEYQALAEAIEADPAAKREFCKLWKPYMMKVLHLIYYRKREA